MTAEVTDRHGMPVARMDYTQCENDRKNIAFAKQTLHDIFEAAGAQDVLEIDRYAHLVGGCRMGSDPERSVVDSDHRAWEVPNLFIADGSVMPTQGSANPALTIMALASRLAERLDLKRRDDSASRRARGDGGRACNRCPEPVAAEPGLRAARLACWSKMPCAPSSWSPSTGSNRLATRAPSTRLVGLLTAGPPSWPGSARPARGRSCCR